MIDSTGWFASMFRPLRCKSQDVAPALRPVLESFLRTAFVEYFPPGKMLGDFLTVARQHAANRTPILFDDDLAELVKLREYANQFHHDKNTAWQQSISNVNEKELSGFAGRLLKFTRPFTNRRAAKSKSA